MRWIAMAALLLTAGQTFAQSPCGSEEPPVTIDLGAGEHRTEAGVRARYRYDRAGRVVEVHERVLEGDPRGPREGRTRYRYDRAGHLVEMSRWDGQTVLIDRNSKGHIERFRFGRAERIARQWTETRVEWVEASAEQVDAPDLTALVLYGWSGRLRMDYLSLLDGGRSGEASTTRFECTSRTGRGRRRSRDAECEAVDWGRSRVRYDSAGRLEEGTLDGRFQDVALRVTWEHGLPTRLREAKTDSGQSEADVTTTVLHFEGERLASVDFGEGRTRHLERDDDGRVTTLEERRRPVSRYSPDRVTTFAYRCR